MKPFFSLAHSVPTLFLAVTFGLVACSSRDPAGPAGKSPSAYDKESNAVTEMHDSLKQTAASFGQSAAQAVRTNPPNSNQKTTVADIRAGQERLKNLGYYTGPIDGVVGQFTDLGLKRFQADHHLTPNGEFDAKTRNQLFQSAGQAGE